MFAKGGILEASSPVPQAAVPSAVHDTLSN
jgi:hypothetical protein